MKCSRPFAASLCRGEQGLGPVVAPLCRGMQGYQGIPRYLLDSIKNLLTVYEFGVNLSNRWESLFIKSAVFSNPWFLPLYSRSFASICGSLLLFGCGYAALGHPWSIQSPLLTLLF